MMMQSLWYAFSQFRFDGPKASQVRFIAISGQIEPGVQIMAFLIHSAYRYVQTILIPFVLFIG